MNKTHQNNHYIPKSILKYWVTQVNSACGVWVYNILKNNKEYAMSSGRKAYKFAIAKDLYVPFINGNRNIFMESKWLNKLETTLAPFVEQLHARDEQIRINNHSDIAKIQMAIHSMFYRSRYNLEQFMKFIEKNSDIRNSITNNPEDDNKRIILEMIINLIIDNYIKFNFMEIVITYFPEGGLIYCDRPFIIENNNKNLLGLTNKVFISFNQSNQFKYQYRNGSESLKKNLNNRLALNSRDWIIAETESQLDEYIEIVNSESWKKGVESDMIIEQKYEYLPFGWQFKDKN